MLSGQIQKFKDLKEDRVFDKEKSIKNAIKKLESLGVEVEKINFTKIRATTKKTVEV